MKAVISPSYLKGCVTAPASKSAGHRSLICAALSSGNSVVKNLGDSNDISATIGALTALGATVVRDGSTATVTPLKRNGKNVTINFNESGSTARFLIPICAALGAENITFCGRGRLPLRPFDTLTEALRQNGVTCSSDTLPMTISGQLKAGCFKIRGDISSQYISGLMLALSIIPGESEIILTSPLQSRDYCLMTVNELRAFGAEIEVLSDRFVVKGKSQLTPTERTVEGDWSQAAFHLCAGAVGGDITVKGLDLNTLQGDSAIIDLLCRFGADVTVSNNAVTVKKSALKGITIDASQIPDLVPILAVTAAFADGTTVITNAERLRIKESDRLKETALRLRAFGIKADETADGLVITGGKPKGCAISSANDHRIVMAFSVMAANSLGETIITDSEAINKSYPLFFNDFSSIGGRCNVIGDR